MVFFVSYTDERIRVGRDYQAIVPDLVPVQGMLNVSKVLNLLYLSLLILSPF